MITFEQAPDKSYNYAKLEEEEKPAALLNFCTVSYTHLTSVTILACHDFAQFGQNAAFRSKQNTFTSWLFPRVGMSHQH